MNREVTLDRTLGLFLGGAVGDAMGAAVEFLSLEEIRQQYGRDGITAYDTAYGVRGALTDDTQMTLFTAEGLLRADNRWKERGICSPPHVVWDAYQRWLITQGERGKGHHTDQVLRASWLLEQRVLHHRRAPGNTCLSALRRGRVGTVEQPINDSKGCGGIMRIAPVGLMADDPFRMGCELAALTHGHPSGYLASGAFALIINRLYRGEAIESAVREALAAVRSHRGHEETTEAMHGALHAAETLPPSPEAVETLGAGWVAEEALAIALYCALVSADFRSALLLAVNHSGDSDSTGSLVGQLLGARDGVGVIPAEWLRDLEGRDVLETMARDFVAHAAEPPSRDLPADIDRYPPN